MLKSMTGYGRCAVSACGCDFTAEIRSVNHRYLDCSVRVPRLFVFLEDAVKSCVSNRLSRGKVDVFLSVDSNGADNVGITLNKPVVSAYLDAMRELKSGYGLDGEPTVQFISRMPDVFIIKKEEPDAEAVTAAVTKAVSTALDGLEAMRIAEGERLCGSILSQMDVIGQLTASIERRSAETLPEYRAKLETRMREVLEGSDIEESRLLSEAALFADKTAVNEEIVRLRSHLTQLAALMRSNGAQGRKADFLIQELHREANTIGSKGGDAELAHMVVDLKAEIEKIREQVQNLE
ncbi:MAG: YicC family protein [Oscillospiraceae bacterium]|nr:YicC family protein [Oscillospiraceae bacterium]